MRDYVTANGTTTYFLYDGSSPVLEETYSASSGTTTIQVADGFADGWRERASGANGGFSAYAFDPQGTLQGEDVNSNTLRTAVNTYVYDGYGTFLVGLHVGENATTGYNQDPVQFGGQYGYYTDVSTGEVDLTHRYYDPSTGHFLNRDPIGYNGGQNLYAFCGNNPVVRKDPSGTIEDADDYDPAEEARDEEYNPYALDYDPKDNDREVELARYRDKLLNPEPIIRNFPGWEPGDPIDKLTPEGKYPIWSCGPVEGKPYTVAGRYWMNRAASASEGEFTKANLGRMRLGFAPRMLVTVRWNKTGVVGTIEVSKTLHHAAYNRGVPGFDTPRLLLETWPWEHDWADPEYHTGYKVIHQVTHQ